MSSQINPDNIDTSYPVAGQDNSTQGFRTNFTNIKGNFQFAEDEITALQNNVVLKSALSGQNLDNNMHDNLLYAAQIQDFAATRVEITPVVISSVLTATINYSSGHTITLPAGVTYVNAAGIVGLNASTNVITFPAAGKYTFDFATYQNGSNVTVSQNNNLLLPFNNSSENLSNGASANTAVTTSYFSTTGAWTATMPAGIEGQTKVLSMYAHVGNMVITVTNAGWKTSGTGTITFTAIGQACTLRYINSKWFCIGNNGCTFG